MRTLDLNPFAPLGVTEEQSRFLELLLLHCLLTESAPITGAEQNEIDQRELAVAWEGRRPGLELRRGGRPVALRDWALEVLNQLDRIAGALGADRDAYAAACANARASVLDPETALSARVIGALESGGKSFLAWALERAAEQREHFLAFEFEPHRRAELDEAARKSLAEAAALEAANEPPFEEFLARFLATGIGPAPQQA